MKLPMLRIALLLSLLACTLAAQKVPVSMVATGYENEDRTALRFSRSLSDEIQLSGKFYLWTENDSALPANGIRIRITSIQVKLRTGNDLGSAIFVQMLLPSAIDPGYDKLVAWNRWLITNDSSVAEITRSFLADVDRIVELSKSR